MKNKICWKVVRDHWASQEKLKLFIHHCSEHVFFFLLFLSHLLIVTCTVCETTCESIGYLVNLLRFGQNLLEIGKKSMRFLFFIFQQLSIKGFQMPECPYKVKYRVCKLHVFSGFSKIVSRNKRFRSRPFSSGWYQLQKASASRHKPLLAYHTLSEWKVKIQILLPVHSKAINCHFTVLHNWKHSHSHFGTFSLLPLSHPPQKWYYCCVWCGLSHLM